MKRLVAAACTVAVLAATACGNEGDAEHAVDTSTTTATTQESQALDDNEKEIRFDALKGYMGSVDRLKEQGVNVNAMILLSISDALCPMVESGKSRREIEDVFVSSQPEVPRDKAAITVDEITSVRCPINDDGVQTISDGMNIVGSDIQPGVYRASGSTLGCYWARLSGFTGAGSDIIANDFSSDGQVVVEILPTDKAFKTTGCGSWEKVQ